MKKKSFVITIVYLIFLPAFPFWTGCSNHERPGDQSSQAIIEIHNSEKAFEQMAAQKGIAEAFCFFADSNAVIMRQKDALIKGKEKIRQYYSASFYSRASVTWSPDFIAASKNGDMGYTYGNYLWQIKDSSGKLTKLKGIFHTVWKKQKDGSWKYVWD